MENSIKSGKKLQDITDAEWLEEMGTYLKSSKKASNLESKVKTPSAKKVLQLMDNSEDGCTRFCEFLEQVSKEDGIPKERLSKELEPFI
jgi:hypothetical protein